MIEAWVLSDGNAGTENQCVGLAEAVGLPFSVRRVKPHRVARALPASVWTLPVASFPLSKLVRAGDPLQPPWPRLLVASGKASVGAAIAIRRASEGRTYSVQLQDPRVPPHNFDLVIPPRHDGLSGRNVFSTFGSLNRITQKRLDEAAQYFGSDLAHLPRPLMAFFVGGDSKHYKLDESAAFELGNSLRAAQETAKAGLLVTFSRRTRSSSAAILRELLDSPSTNFWNGHGQNPYFGYLACADYLFVTEDSVSMTSEAASTGKPIYILGVPGGNQKFDDFHENLQTAGITRRFAGHLDLPWNYDKLDETSTVAALVCERLFISHNTNIKIG